MPQHPTAPRPSPGDGRRSDLHGEPPTERRMPPPGPWGPPGAGPVPGARPPVVPGPRRESWPPSGNGNGNGGDTRRIGPVGGATAGQGERADGDSTVVVDTAPAAARPDLSVNKLLAGAGASVTSAALGSFFGAEGTVFGAAFGSVASTVATTLYQRSLDRTRDTLVARIRVNRRGEPIATDDPDATVLLPRQPADGEPPPDRPDVAGGSPSRRRWLIGIGASVLVFVIAMVTITGIELAKGSTLTRGNEGTSVGRVIAPAPPAAEDEETGDGAGTDATSTPEPSAESDAPTTATSEADASDPAGPSGQSEQDERDAPQQDEEGAEDDPGAGRDVAPRDADVAPTEAPVAPGTDG